jgi:hypothetical protein
MSKTLGSGSGASPVITLPSWRAVDLLFPTQDSLKSDPMKITGKLPYWAILAILFFVGLLAIIIPGICELRVDHGVISAIGTALLVASILGATIDRWMKAEIASDVFRATLGYILPNEFHDAIHNLISFSFMCEAHEMWYEIIPINDNEVEVRVKTERRIRNITTRPQDVDGTLDIDEWGFPQKSKIHLCELHDVNHNVLRRADPGQLDEEWILHAKSEKLTLPPGQEIIAVSDFSETRRNNDHIVMVFRAPTKNPKIHILASEFGCQFDFGVLLQKRQKSSLSETYTLDGVYFPPANFRLRWYPRKNQ